MNRQSVSTANNINAYKMIRIIITEVFSFKNKIKCIYFMYAKNEKCPNSMENENEYKTNNNFSVQGIMEELYGDFSC